MKCLVAFISIAFSYLVIANDIVCPEGTERFEEMKSEKKVQGCRKPGTNGKMVKQGPYQSFYNDGKIEKRTSLENGKIHGLYEEFFEDGSPKTIENYTHGQLNGDYTEYYSNGSIKVKDTYKNGEQDGNYSAFYANGKLRLSGKNSNGKHLSPWKAWDETGSIIKEGSFESVTSAMKGYDQKKLASIEKPLLNTVFTPCYSEQIKAMQTGGKISNNWIPDKGLLFNGNDQIYKIKLLLSNGPLELLVEGPGQFEDAIKNSCFIVLRVREESFLVSSTTGIKAQIGDSIHDFKVKSGGRITVSLKRLRDISSTDLELPVLELISPVGLVQKLNR